MANSIKDFKINQIVQVSKRILELPVRKHNPGEICVIKGITKSMFNETILMVEFTIGSFKVDPPHQEYELTAIHPYYLETLCMDVIDNTPIFKETSLLTEAEKEYLSLFLVIDKANINLYNSIIKKLCTKHAENIRLYAEDWVNDDEPWLNWEFRLLGDSIWFDLTRHPAWYADHEYRRKPKPININGIKVPEPVKHELEGGDEYYIPDLYNDSLNSKFLWDNDCSPFDKRALERGLVHLTKEAATLHAKALISFTRRTDV